MSEGEDRTVTWALKAAAWAERPYPADPSMTTFAAWLGHVEAEARVTGKVTVMRDQPKMLGNHNHWACLSRLAIMHSPDLAKYIHPAHRQPLDGREGVKLMNELYRRVVGRSPKVRDWTAARDAAERGAFDGR